ncbi:MAG: hypothetical protein JST00_15090 [Deltaproteobacteria bacterium]|nr:hypothetical protein [Deltaproteobacteria bacterium]
MKTPTFVTVLVTAAAALTIGACAAPAEEPADAPEAISSTTQAFNALANCDDLGRYHYRCYARAGDSTGRAFPIYGLVDNVSAWADEQVDIHNTGVAPVNIFVKQLFGTSEAKEIRPGETLRVTSIDKGGPFYAIYMTLPMGTDERIVMLHVDRI